MEAFLGVNFFFKKNGNAEKPFWLHGEVASNKHIWKKTQKKPSSVQNFREAKDLLAESHKARRPLAGRLRELKV